MSYLGNYVDEYTAGLYSIIVEYVDAEYSLWLSWLLTPLLVTFLLPAVIIILIYASAIIFHLYRLYRMRVVDGVQNDWRNAARLAVCALWDAHGWLWHGYEIRGLDKVPKGPCLYIYYHGALPIDMYYFIARLYVTNRKLVHTVADKFMFKIPGWATFLDGLCVIPGTVATCASLLKTGNSLAISPGGVYEAQFSDHYYTLKWKQRTGFARVAQEAKVPIVPIFTMNVREAFRTVGWVRGLWLRAYAAIRFPLVPVYGGFPVKLVTYLGEPIEYDPELTPIQLQRKVAGAIEELIEKHQRVPGSILSALSDRIFEVPKYKEKPSKVADPLPNGKCLNGKVVDKKVNDSSKLNDFREGNHSSKVNDDSSKANDDSSNAGDDSSKVDDDSNKLK